MPNHHCKARHDYYKTVYGDNYRLLMRYEKQCDRGRQALVNGLIEAEIEKKTENYKSEKKGKGKKGKGKKDGNRKKEDKNINDTNEDSGETGNTSDFPHLKTKVVNKMVNPFEENHIKYRDFDMLTAQVIVEEMVKHGQPTSIKTPLETEGNVIVFIGNGPDGGQLRWGIIEDGAFWDVWGVDADYILRLGEKLAAWTASSELEKEYWLCCSLDCNWHICKSCWVAPYKLRNYPLMEVVTKDMYGTYESRDRLGWLDQIDAVNRQLRVEVYLNQRKEEFRKEVQEKSLVG